MGDKKGRKDKAKEQRQAKDRQANTETQKRDRQQSLTPGAYVTKHQQ